MKEEKEYWLGKLQIITLNAIKAYCASAEKSYYPIAHYGKQTCHLEMFSRICYGLIPLINYYHNKDMVDFFNTEINLGCDKDNSAYWGDIAKSDQRIVEMLPMCLNLYFNRTSTWDTYSDKQKRNIINWMLQVNSLEISTNNWLFFRILVNAILQCIEEKNLELSYKGRDDDFERINSLYIGNGWYNDGYEKRVDYYTPFAFHFYGLLYSVICNDGYAEVFKKRAKAFANIYIYFFSPDGSSVPYGRSLTYKMASSAFWSVMAFVGELPFEAGVVKGILFRNLEWWLERDIFDFNGVLSLGYTYPNLLMSEEYNAYGSSYWALKSFIFLLIDDNNIFWQEKIGDLPQLSKKKTDYCGNFTIARDENHVVLFPNNKCTGIFIEGFHAKYYKFAYSNIFGFAVPRGYQCYKEEGLDSVISVSTDNEVFYPRNELLQFKTTEEFLYSVWEPISGVLIHSFIIPGAPWHTRIHYISTSKDIVLRDAGFSIDGGISVAKDENAILIKGESGYSGVFCHTFPDKLKYEHGDTNTNIVFPIYNIPYCEYILRKGNHIISNSFFGCQSTLQWECKPVIEQLRGVVNVKYDGVLTDINAKAFCNRKKTVLNLTKKHLINYLKKLLK